MREGASADTTPTADAQAGDGVPATHAPLAAIRDEWLAPLVERIAELERQVGRLEAERDAARAAAGEAGRWAEFVGAERDQLRAALGQRARDAARTTASAAAGRPLGRLRRAWRALRGG